MSDTDPRFPAGSCDRRQFLGWSAALTLGALAGHTAEAMPPDLVVMALGGAAVNVAGRAREDGLRARFWIWNRDGQASSDVRMPHALRVDVPGSLLGTGAEAHLRAWTRDALLDLRPPLHRVAVVAGLGGRSGSALFPVVVRALAERGLGVGAYCTLPATFEGKKRRLLAEQSLAALAATGAMPRIVRLDDVFRSARRGTSFKQALEEADGRLARPLRRFLRAG